MSQFKRNRVAALSTSAAGLLTALMIYKHPEKLHAPEWIAYSVCAAFVIAGLVLLVRDNAGSATYRWLVVSLMALMVVPPTWIAVGPGSQMCYAAFFGVEFLSASGACRLAFGVGALMLGCMLIWAVREALAVKSAEKAAQPEKVSDDS